MIRHRSLLALVWAGAIGAALLPAARAGAPVDEARKLTGRIKAMKSLSELPPLLTNETAGSVGIVFVSKLQGFAGMAEAFAGMGKPDAPPDPKQAAKLKMLKTLSAEVNRSFVKYGLDPKKQASELTAADRKKVVSAGRGLLADMLKAMAKMPSDGPGKGFDVSKAAKIPLDRLTYKQLSGTRVKITDPTQPNMNLEARLEDGAWRLHILDFQKAIQGAAPGGPPGGGARRSR